MSGFTFDSNIVIDALGGHHPARVELERAVAASGAAWISRMVWIEVMSKGPEPVLKQMREFLDNFAVDELDRPIAEQAAALRRERPSLKGPDAIILATALHRGRILVTRNTKDFHPAHPGVRIPYTL